MNQIRPAKLLFIIVVTFIFCFSITDLQGQVRSKEIPASLQDSVSKFELLMNQAGNCLTRSQYDSLRAYSMQALNIAHALKSDTMQIIAYKFMALYFDNSGEYYLALQYAFKALNLAEKLVDKTFAVNMMNNISWMHIELFDYSKGIEYVNKAIPLTPGIKNLDKKHKYLAMLYNNMAIAYFESGKQDSSLIYNKMALEYLDTVREKGILRWIYSIFGRIYEYKKDFVLAENYYGAATDFTDSLNYADGLIYGISRYCHFLSSKNQFREAISLGKRGISLAKMVGYKRYLIEIAEELRKAYATQNQIDSAYTYASLAMAYRDSVFNEQKSIQLKNLIFDKALNEKELKHEKEIEAAKRRLENEKMIRNFFIAGFVLVFLFAGIFLKQRNLVKKGKKRSDELLLNILPSEVAEELKDNGSALAKQFDEVTVMFTDFKDFTQISEKLSPTDLVAEIHTCFKAFDQIVTKYNIEKIKTIGDSYMCVGGLPNVNNTHAADVVNAALEIQHFIARHKLEKLAKGEIAFEIRIGIHSGPVVAGIVGVKKFAYDIWGDTVNLAARMENSGEAGKINISGTTHELVKNSFHCTYRGKISAKNKGEVDMYFVESKISEV